MPLNKSWNYNESLIELVSVLIYVSFLKPSNQDVIKLSNGKVGAPVLLHFAKIGISRVDCARS